VAVLWALLGGGMRGQTPPPAFATVHEKPSPRSRPLSSFSPERAGSSDPDQTTKGDHPAREHPSHTRFQINNAQEACPHRLCQPWRSPAPGRLTSSNRRKVERGAVSWFGVFFANGFTVDLWYRLRLTGKLAEMN